MRTDYWLFVFSVEMSSMLAIPETL